LRVAWLLTLLTLVPAARPSSTAAQNVRAQRPANWPHRVLLTNDDGIDSPALRALAGAFAAAGIQTYVAAPSRDRSGTGSLMTSLQTDAFVVEPKDLGPGIEAWAVDAFPADCVLFALRGPMADDPPDLVVSGPNIGANVGEAWFISGTVGAARAAAFFGVPAVAISGANVRDSLSVETIARWFVQFVRSEPVRRLRAPEYLNVNVPINPRGVRGATVTERARVLNLTVQRDTSSSTGEGQQRWRLGGSMSLATAAPGTDAFAFARDSISIEPLRVGEHDSVMAAWLSKHMGLVPPWPIADTAGKGGQIPRSR
jgi:5'-nucleotidase